MNKTDLANRIAEKHGVAKERAREIVDDVFSQIADALASGETVAIDKFGRFKANDRPARKGKNPKTGAPIDIPATRAAGFSASKHLKSSLNG
jgi:DNA-binding protein HU-beta